MTTTVSIIDRLRTLIPERSREGLYRAAGAITMLLFGLGVLTSDQAAQWAQLAVSLITLLFAFLYAATPWRLALYAVTGPLGSILMAYGIVNDVRWAVIASSVGYALGITTAAAKTIQPGTVDPAGQHRRAA